MKKFCGIPTSLAPMFTRSITLASISLTVFAYGAISSADQPSSVALSSVHQLPQISLKIDPSTQQSEEGSFKVPVGAISAQIVAEGESDARFLINSLIDPQGRVLVSESPEGVEIPSSMEPFRSLLGPLLGPNPSAMSEPGSASLMIPNTPSVQLIPGRYRYRIQRMKRGDDTAPPSNLRVRVYFKSSSVALHSVQSSRVELCVYSRPEARGSSRLSNAVRAAQSIYSSYGISLQVRLMDPTPLSSWVTPNDESYRQVIPQLLRSLNTPAGCIRVVFAPLDSSMGAEGMSFAVPGFPQEAGGVASGVLVSETPSAASSTDEELGLTLAHELGHYLGLAHSEETVPFLKGVSNQIPGDREMGNANLMYPQPALGSRLSPGQVENILRHPAVSF